MKIVSIFIAGLLFFLLSCGQQTQQAEKSGELDMAAMLQPVPKQAVLQDSLYYTWGASAVKGGDGLYHLYYSRWKKEYGFLAWVTHSEIAHAVSTDLLGPYAFKDIALPIRGANFWDGLTTHNPIVQRFGDTYYLYYMGTTGDGINVKGGLNWTHRNNQRIGVAVSKSPDGPWQRFDQPLLDVSSDSTAADALAVNNPSVIRRPDGKYLMVYKAIGKQKPLPFGGPVVHLTAVSDNPTGPFVKHDKPIFTKEGVLFPAEDPFVWYQDGVYYAIVKDMDGVFTGEGRSLALFTSPDGEDWQPAPHTLVSKLEICWEGGQQDSVCYLERPQLYLEDGKPRALFLAVSHQDANVTGHTYNIHVPLEMNKKDQR